MKKGNVSAYVMERREDPALRGDKDLERLARAEAKRQRKRAAKAKEKAG
jgi:hypothetical protein